jgi:phosphatidate phosphatase LPIN
VKVHSTHPTSKQLEAMAEHLQLGQNTVEFISGNQTVQSFIHLFNWNIRLVISDIDGTITRSDVLGHVLPPFGVDWSHPGVTRLFSNIADNGYQFVYLSSRSIAQSGITRAFLESLKQKEHGLPNGACSSPFFCCMQHERAFDRTLESQVVATVC